MLPFIDWRQRVILMFESLAFYVTSQRASDLKIAVFWVVAPCSLVGDRPDDGGSKDL
jgi:hypothetical protein